MRDLIYEAGYLITYLFCELDKIKRVDPILCKFDFHNHKTTKEFRGPLEESIPKLLDAYEESERDSAKVIAIFPAEIKDENKEKYNALVLIAKDFLTEQRLVLIFPYEFHKEKLYISTYEVIESINIEEEELEKLNINFLKGALNFKECLYLWQERFIKEDSLV